MLYISFRKMQTQASDSLSMACGKALSEIRTGVTLGEPQKSKLGWKDHVLGLFFGALDNR